MPTGRVKTYDADRRFGFIVPDDGGKDLYVAADQVTGDLNAGDHVSFEVSETEGKEKNLATKVKVERKAPRFSPVGRVMTPPPVWDELEERDRQARAARRRRR